MTYSLVVLTQDSGLQVSSVRSVGPSGPTQSLYFCVNQGTDDGLDGVYRLGLTTGSYSQLYTDRVVQSVAIDGEDIYLSTGDGPFWILKSGIGLTQTPEPVYTASKVVWDLAPDFSAGELRFTEDHLVRSIPLGGGTAVTLATFSYWMRELTVDPTTGDIWSHAQEHDLHMLVRLDQALSWSASVVIATTSYIGGLVWSGTHSGPLFTCGLNSAGIYSMSGPTAVSVPVESPWASTYSAWKSITIGDSGDIILGSLVFGTGETASYVARLIPE